MKFFCSVIVAMLSMFTLSEVQAQDDNLELLQGYMQAQQFDIAANNKEYTEETIESLRHFQRYFDRIREEWVGEISDQELIDAAVEGMLKDLDQHSSYLTPKAAEDLMAQTRGEFTGVGMEVTKDEVTGYVRVVTPIDGTPAFRAGVKAGDLVTEVDGKDTKIHEGKEMTLSDAVDWLRGPRFSTVTVKIIRNGNEETIDIVRDIIRLISVKSALVDNNIAYVRVSTFSGGVTRDVINAINKARIDLEAAHPNAILQGLILDLRNNPGGLLNESIEMADLFLMNGNIIHTKGRDGETQESWDAFPTVFVRRSMPIVVLINKGSASASEIVSGALQDLNRATIIGVKSFGKGSVQTIFNDMGRGYGLRLTTRYYYTASDKKIHGVGITPNIVIDLPKEYKKENWYDIDPQMEIGIAVIHSGYRENCAWSITEDTSVDGYGAVESCPEINE